MKETDISTRPKTLVDVLIEERAVYRDYIREHGYPFMRPHALSPKWVRVGPGKWEQK